jgi:hypothetical protein
MASRYQHVQLPALSPATSKTARRYLEEWGGYCGRVAEGLVTRYDLSERAVGFFRFFAAPAPGFPEQAESVAAAGLAAGEDPQEAVRAALALHAYEIASWDALADGLG